MVADEQLGRIDLVVSVEEREIEKAHRRGAQRAAKEFEDVGERLGRRIGNSFGFMLARRGGMLGAVAAPLAGGAVGKSIGGSLSSAGGAAVGARAAAGGAGRVAGAAVAGAGATVASGGALLPLAVAAIGTTIAIRNMGKIIGAGTSIIKKFTERIEASSQRLIPFSPELTIAGQVKLVQQLGRDLQRARTVGGDISQLQIAKERLKNAVAPVENLIDKFKTIGATHIFRSLALQVETLTNPPTLDPAAAAGLPPILQGINAILLLLKRELNKDKATEPFEAFEISNKRMFDALDEISGRSERGLPGLFEGVGGSPLTREDERGFGPF